MLVEPPHCITLSDNNKTVEVVGVLIQQQPCKDDMEMLEQSSIDTKDIPASMTCIEIGSAT